MSAMSSARLATTGNLSSYGSNMKPVVVDVSELLGEPLIERLPFGGGHRVRRISLVPAARWEINGGAIEIDQLALYLSHETVAVEVVAGLNEHAYRAEIRPKSSDPRTPLRLTR